MVKIKPFKAIRPNEGVCSRVAALPYDVYNRKEAKEETKREPLSFLNIDRAESQFDDSVDTYADCVYEKANEMFVKWCENGTFVKDERDCFYIYELIMDGRSQNGIVACASIDDYISGSIRKHENTRADKEADRIRHVDSLSAQTGPIFLSYRSCKPLAEIIANTKKEKPLYDFTTEDGITHRCWVVDEAYNDDITDAFAAMERVYIADGHHRCASAVRVGQKRRDEHPGYTGSEEFNYFLSVLFADDELMIMDYNRVIKDLNGYTLSQVFDKLKAIGSLEEIGDSAKAPERKGEVSIYADGLWYKLKFNDEICSDDPVDGLDVSILQNNVLSPIFGIDDPKTDKRIDFVGGIRGLSELERRVQSDCKIAFAMYPTGIGELFAVADAGRLMPPKSTWFEPKLRSGLFIHEIER